MAIFLQNPWVKIFWKSSIFWLLEQKDAFLGYKNKKFQAG